MADDAWPGTPYDPKDAPALKSLSGAIRGHEGGGVGVISPQGAEGPGQVMPGTFRQYALPGERVDRGSDNTNVSDRIIRSDFYKFGKDPGKVATAYFSGDANVNPGKGVPYKRNVSDVNEPVSAYVANVEKRLPKQAEQWPGKPLEQWPGQPLHAKSKQPWRVPPAQEGPRAGPFAAAPHEAPLRQPGPMDPSIQARQNVAPALTGYFAPEQQVYAMLKADPAGTLKKIGAATLQEAKAMIAQLSPSALTSLAQKVGAETAANTATPETAGDVANLAQLGIRGAPREMIKSPAIKTADGRIVEGPNHPAIRAAGTDGEPGFTTTTGEASVNPTLQIPSRKVGSTPANPPAPKYVEEARQEAIDFAEKAGLTTQVSQLANEGWTAKQISEKLKGRLSPDDVRAVRDNLGIKPVGPQGGLITPGPNFVDREQGAKIATATGQADPEVTSLHSEHLRPQPAGADVTTKAVLQGYQAVPPVPTNALVQSIEDGGQRLRGAATNDKALWQQYVNKAPPELKNSELQTRFNKFKEERTPWGDYKILSQPEQDLFKKFALPIAEENADLWQELKKYGAGRKEDEADPFAELDPEYVHRTRKGMTPEFDPWLGEATSNPIGGFRSRSAPAAKERVYYVMESEQGIRKLVAKTDHGMLILNKGQGAQPLPRYQGEATSVGDKFSINGEKWSIKQAKTEEIERETGIEYHKNFMANAIKSNMQLKSAVRAINELNRIKETPEWGAYTVPLGQTPPKGYVVPEFPPFRIVHMDPKMAAAIDSFWTAPKAHLGQKIAAINRYIVSALFLSPFIHAANVGTHWFVARGFDWVNPMAYPRMVKTFPEAVVEVVTQGPKYREMLRDGAGLVYGSIANEEFHRKMLQGLGEQIKREPWKWVPILQPLGMAPKDLINAIYGVSSRLLWMTSDAFMMQRVLELRESGMGKLDSIEEAEKHIPNYRIPSQVLGQPGIAKALKDPSLFAFSRYDYGVFKSYAHMAKDLVQGSGPLNIVPNQASIQAIGNIMALGFLTYYVWPYINQGIQKITGDKDLEFGPRGALKLPMLLRDMASGGKHLDDIIPSLLTLAPIPEMGVQVASGFKDHFGRNIVEPGDWQKHRMGRMGGQVGEWIGQSANPLYAEAAQGMEDRKTGGLRGAGERVLRQQLGVRKTPKPYMGRTGGGTYQQQAQHRRTHPHGPIEQLEKRAEEWLGQ